MLPANKQENISQRFSSNFEASASELLETIFVMILVLSIFHPLPVVKGLFKSPTNKLLPHQNNCTHTNAHSNVLDKLL